VFDIRARAFVLLVFSLESQIGKKKLKSVFTSRTDGIHTVARLTSNTRARNNGARRRNRGRRGGALSFLSNDSFFDDNLANLFNKNLSFSLRNLFFSAVFSHLQVFTFSLINQTHTGCASFARLHHRRRTLRRTVVVRALFVPKLLPVRFFRPPVRLGRVRVLLFVVFPGIRRRSRRGREKRQSRRRIRR
jgi:hypothetical protein